MGGECQGGFSCLAGGYESLKSSWSSWLTFTYSFDTGFSWMDPWAQLSAEHARTGDRSAMIASSAAIFQSVESCQLRRAFLRGGYNPGPLSLLIVTWIHLEVSSRLTRLLHSVPVLGGWQNFWIVEWWPVDVDFLGHKLGYWVRKLHITNIPHTHIIFIYIYIYMHRLNIHVMICLQIKQSPLTQHGKQMMS